MVLALVAVSALAMLAMIVQAFRNQRYTQGQADAYMADRRRLQEEWRDERRELLNRIQRPEIVQHAPVMENFPTPEPEPDDIGLVGSIRHDPDYEFDSTLADALTEAAFPQKG